MIASEAVTVALIAACGGICAAIVSGVAAIASSRSRRSLVELRDELATGNGHTAGQALARLESEIFAVRMTLDGAMIRLAEHAERITEVESRLTGQTSLVAEHLVDVSKRTRLLDRLAPYLERLALGNEQTEGEP